MKANRIIKQNIEALLKARGLPRRDLAQWCYRSDSWLSKILREERREFAAKDLDRIADFFGPTNCFNRGSPSNGGRVSIADRGVSVAWAPRIA